MPETDTATTADAIAAEHPEQIDATPELVSELQGRVQRAAEADDAVRRAVGEGLDVVAAIAAGCPPQFHPGVPPAQAEILATLRGTLGLDRVTAFRAAPDCDGAELRVLSAVGVDVTVA